MANHTRTTSFDCAAIMRAAWKRFRDIRSQYGAWQIAQGIVDASFAEALRIAWRQAKKAAVEAAKTIKLTTGPNAERAARIQSEIDMLAFKSLRYDTVTMRRRLEAELSALAA